jgi:hypothetical protein
MYIPRIMVRFNAKHRCRIERNAINPSIAGEHTAFPFSRCAVEISEGRKAGLILPSAAAHGGHASAIASK